MVDKYEEYISIDNLEMRIQYDYEDLFSNDEDDMRDYKELLKDIRKSAVDILESHFNDNTFVKEEREDIIKSKDNKTINLVYPVIEINSVEFKRSYYDDYKTLTDSLYYHDKHNLYLRDINKKYYRRNFGIRNKFNKRYDTFKSFSDLIKIEYERGYDDIPANIKTIIVRICNNILRNMKDEDNIIIRSPQETREFVKNNSVIDKETEKLIDDVIPLTSSSFMF
ncbi:MAG: hypothetical protein ACOCRX_11545 [Candidatus Woesearchaeota archaeon]